MVFFENRSGMYILVHEHRKLKRMPFADLQSVNIYDLSGADHIKGILRIAFQLFLERREIADDKALLFPEALRAVDGDERHGDETITLGLQGHQLDDAGGGTAGAGFGQKCNIVDVIGIGVFRQRAQNGVEPYRASTGG